MWFLCFLTSLRCINPIFCSVGWWSCIGILFAIMEGGGGRRELWMIGFSRVILKISPHCRRKTVFDSTVAVAAQSNLLPALGLVVGTSTGRYWVLRCSRNIGREAARFEGVLFRDCGTAVSILWIWIRKLQRKVLILYDPLTKLKYIIRNTDSITRSPFDWEGHESGWRKVKGRELKFSSCCDQMFLGFQQR